MPAEKVAICQKNHVEPLLALASQAAGWHLSADLNVTAFVDRRAISATFFFFLPGWVRSAACALTLEEKTLQVLLRHRFDSPTGKKTKKTGTDLRRD